jgi:uncharacterized protein
MERAILTVVLLVCSNVFMTMAWYGHLKKSHWPLLLAIVVSWLIASFEYMFQVPANRYGHYSHGGPFTAPQLKVLQEAITLSVFAGFTILYLNEKPRINDVIAFVLILAAVVISMMGRGKVLD